MLTSQKTKTPTEQASSSEVVNILVQVLAKAKKFVAPALLMVEFSTEYTRQKTSEELKIELKSAGDELVDIDLRKPVNLLELIGALNPNQVGSIHGLHAQPEVVRQLNWGRERLTDNNRRVVFWLNFDELKDLAERAPDFWAFRNRQLSLPSYEGKFYLIESESYLPNVIELSNLPLNTKRDRAEALEELLKNISDPNSERAKNLHDSLGQLYWELGDVEIAIKYYEQALKAAHEDEDKQRENNYLGKLGNAYFALGEVQKAIIFYEQALSISHEIGDRRNEGDHLGNLGIIYHSLGEFQKAIDYHEQALIVSREIHNEQGESADLGNLGNVHRSMEKFQEAIKYFEQALSISHKILDRRSEGTWLANLGLSYLSLGEIPKSISYLEQSLTIAREVGDKRNEGTNLGNLGLAYRDLGELEKSINYLKQSLSIAREIGNKRGEAFQLWNLGLVYNRLNEVTTAIALHILAFNIFGSISSPYAWRVFVNLKQLQESNEKFDLLLRSLLISGDSILQKATAQTYNFFRSVSPDTPDRILTMLYDFEKQQKK